MLYDSKNHESALHFIAAVCVVTVPLGLWKLVEIVNEVSKHLKWAE